MYKYIASCLSHAISQTVVHIYIHTARKTDGELDSLTVHSIEKKIKITLGGIRTRLKPSTNPLRLHSIALDN